MNCDVDECKNKGVAKVLFDDGELYAQFCKYHIGFVKLEFETGCLKDD